MHASAHPGAATLIPIQDVIPTRARPVATLGLLAANAAAFAWQAWAGDTVYADSTLARAAFSHPGTVFFVVTLLFLWLFGDNVEDQTGRWRFVLLYLSCGLSAAVAADAIAPGLARAGIGAAGAVSGILGAYFVLYPRARVLVLVPVPLSLHELPAAFFLGVWFVAIVLTLAAHNRAGAPGDIALGLSAHAIAFAAGALLCLLLRRRERAGVEWWDGNGR